MTDMDLFNYVNQELNKKVSLDRFTPVEKIVYGGAGLILTSVAVYALSFLFKK